MRYLSLLVILFLLLANSCSKEQRYVKKLDGTWQVESVTYTGKKPEQLFVEIDSAIISPPCTERTFEEIKKIWFYECKLKVDGECDWDNGVPTNCDPDEIKWCTGNIVFAHKDDGCNNGRTGDDDFIVFRYRIEEKGGKLVTEGIDNSPVFEYNIISLDKNKAVFEYKSDTISYTLTLKSIEDDKP